MLAKRLMEHFGSVSRVMNATIDELTLVNGLGGVSAKKIRVVLDSESL